MSKLYIVGGKNKPVATVYKSPVGTWHTRETIW